MLNTSPSRSAGRRRISLNLRFTTAMILLATLLIAIFCVLDYHVMSDNTERLYTDKVVSAVMNASSVTSGDTVNEVVQAGEYIDSFQDTMRILDDIKTNSDIMYLYLFTLGDDGITYVYTACRDGEDPATMLPLGSYESYADLGGNSLFLQTVETHKASSSLTKEQSGNWGYVASSFAPVFDSKGDVVALIGADCSMTEIMAEVRGRVISLALISSAVVALLIILFSLYFNRAMIKPLHGLTGSALGCVSDTVTGDGISFNKLALRNNDEINDLNEAFAQMADDVNMYLNEIKRVTTEKEKILAELSVARRIQSMFLPRLFPPFANCENLLLYATMDPAKDVGGDFYDFYMVDDDHFCMTIADVSGKGVPAALFMVIAKTIMKNLALTGISTAEIITRANEQLADGNDENMFVTTFLSILDIRTGELRFTNAGHNAPLIKQPGGDYEFLKVKKQLVVGAMGGIKYRENIVTLQPGAQMFLYTDGVSEAMNTADELYGDKRLIADVNAACSGESDAVNDQIAAFADRLHAYVGKAEQSDDITMMMMRYKG